MPGAYWPIPARIRPLIGPRALGGRRGDAPWPGLPAGAEGGGGGVDHLRREERGGCSPKSSWQWRLVWVEEGWGGGRRSWGNIDPARGKEEEEEGEFVLRSLRQKRGAAKFKRHRKGKGGWKSFFARLGHAFQPQNNFSPLSMLGEKEAERNAPWPSQPRFAPAVGDEEGFFGEGRGWMGECLRKGAF